MYYFFSGMWMKKSSSLEKSLIHFSQMPPNYFVPQALFTRNSSFHLFVFFFLTLGDFSVVGIKDIGLLINTPQTWSLLYRGYTLGRCAIFSDYDVGLMHLGLAVALKLIDSASSDQKVSSFFYQTKNILARFLTSNNWKLDEDFLSNYKYILVKILIFLKQRTIWDSLSWKQWKLNFSISNFIVMESGYNFELHRDTLK